MIEHILRRYLRERKHAQMHNLDLKRINDAAAELNIEAADVLDYQASDE